MQGEGSLADALLREPSYYAGLIRASILFEKANTENDGLAAQAGNDAVEKIRRPDRAHRDGSTASSLNPRRLSNPSGVGSRPRKAV